MEGSLQLRSKCVIISFEIAIPHSLQIHGKVVSVETSACTETMFVSDMYKLLHYTFRQTM